MKMYCSCCDKIQPVFVGDCIDAKTNESYQDIVCAECALVVASGTGIQQPVQEPVGFFAYDNYGDLFQLSHGSLSVKPIPLYAAPVRTKDLTDDEIYPLYNEPTSDKEAIKFARAVIAADREKNK